MDMSRDCFEIYLHFNIVFLSILLLITSLILSQSLVVENNFFNLSVF